jgi:hypothetical protein
MQAGCSITFGKGVTSAPPGSSEGLRLTVYDIDEAPSDLVGRGVDVGEPFHDVTGIFHHAGTEGRVSGPAPGHADYGSFAALAIRTATAGCSRRSRRGSRAAERRG